MKISYQWLKDLVEIELSPDQLAEKLTLVGLELDGMHEAGDDFVLDIETTSNRGDCLSHFGVAREIAAFSGKPLKSTPADIPSPGQANNLVTIADPDICHRFTARVIRGVEIKPSPEWLQKRLIAVGERPINNVADISNYVMHELGQPMHAFDLDRLEGQRIVVRRAAEGETIRTLDEVDRKLDKEMLAICDTTRPAAIGGVMGGFDSGINEGTLNILLEVACFEPLSIRRTSKELGLATEASYRFERGVDIENLKNASDRATQLILEIAGGEAGEFADVYPTRRSQVTVDAPDLSSEVKRLSGLDVSEDDAIAALRSLGIEHSGGSTFVSPSWRHDLHIEEDLVEEFVRLTGYELIGSELPGSASTGEYQPSEQRKRRLRTYLSAGGFSEAISYSFIEASYDEVFGMAAGAGSNGSEGFVEVRDPVIEGAVRMRPSLLPGLLKALKNNLNHGSRNVRLFEIGNVFSKVPSESRLPREREVLAIAITGNELFEGSESQGNELDFFDLKGALELSFESLHCPEPELRPAPTGFLQPGQSAEIYSDGEMVGVIGKLAKEINEGFKFKQPVYVLEVDLEGLLESPPEPGSYTRLPVFPAIDRDITLAIDRKITFARVRKAVEALGFELCRRVSYVDVFEGKGLAVGERALTVRLEYRSDERTLTENEVDEIHGKIVGHLKDELDATIR